MTHTRYTPKNAILLLLGGVVCILVVFLNSMTAGFGADPPHDFRSAAIACLLVVALVTVPAYLAMFRWSGIGSRAMWVTTIAAFVFAAAGGFSLIGIVVLLLIESLIFNEIDSTSINAHMENE